MDFKYLYIANMVYGGVLGDLIRIAVGFDFVVSANVLAWFELYARRFMKF